MAVDGWQRILRAMDEAFAEYEHGLVTLRNRVVADLRRKLKAAERSADKGTTGEVRRS